MLSIKNNSNSGKTITWKPGIVTLINGTCTAIIGYSLHHSIFWTIVDFIFWPIALIKWLIFQEINMSYVKELFSTYLN